MSHSHKLCPLISLLVVLVSGPAWSSEGLSSGKLYNLAIQGDSNAQYFLGLAYCDGSKGLKQDSLKAERWLEQASEGGHELAFTKLEEIRRTPKSTCQAPQGHQQKRPEPASVPREDVLHLLCDGKKLSPYTGEWQSGWTQSLKIDIEQERLVEYQSKWSKSKSNVAITSVSVEISDTTIVIHDDLASSDGRFFHQIVIQRTDGAFTAGDPTNIPPWNASVRGRCSKAEQRAF